MNKKTGIWRAVNIAGSQNKLAQHLGVVRTSVVYWCKMGHVPPEHCVAIWRHTGVPLYELNPDVYPKDMMREHGKTKKRAQSASEGVSE